MRFTFSAIRHTLVIGGLLAGLLVAGCATEPSKPKSKPVPRSTGTLSEKAKQEQRQAILKVRNRTLEQLYKLKPFTRTEIEGAAGYGVFEINGLNAVLVEKHGRGMVMERSGKVTFMQLARTDLGPGTSVKPYWQIMVFRDPQQLSQFAMSGSPDNVSSDPKIVVYQLNERGVATQTDWGARYFRDVDLN
ncbi:MAG: hypothetical protein WBQ05_12060 [Candidatus Competibacter denitrificans]